MSTIRINLHVMTMIFAVIVVVIAVTMFSLQWCDAQKLMSKALNLCSFWLSLSLFSRFFLTRNYNVERTIGEHPVALSVYMAGVAVGTALVIVLG